MGRRVLLISPSAEKVQELIECLHPFITEEDALVLAIADSPINTGLNNSGFLPFKFYSLGWRILKDEKLPNLLARSNHSKKRMIPLLIKQSQFLDLVYCPLAYMKEGFDSLNEIFELIKCPIFFFNAKLKEQKEVFIRYSGSEASFNSIRAFQYLFAQNMELLKVQLVVKAETDCLDSENCVYEFLKAKGNTFSISRYFDNSSLFELENSPASKSGIWVLGEKRASVLESLKQIDSADERGLSLFLG